MLKIFQASLQKYMNHELPDVQPGFRKGRGTRDQIANIRWLIEKAREFQKNTYFYFIPDHLTCLLKNLYAGQEATVRTNGLVPNWERSTSRLYIVTLVI